MAALPRMMAVVREEVAVVSADAAVAARASVTTEATAAAKQAGTEVFNPVAVREAAESAAKKALDSSEHSVLGALRHTPQPNARTLSTSTSTVSTTVLQEAAAESTNVVQSTTTSETTIVTQVLEKEMGATVKEAMANAGETGLQEVAEQLAETAKTMLNGDPFGHHGAVQAAVPH